MNSKVLYTPEEIAEKLKISKYTVYEMIKRGDIAAHRLGRHLRISDEQLTIYLNKTKEQDNIYQATIIKDGDDIYAQVDSIKIFVSTNLTGKAKISIAPEDIILSLDAFPTSARNVHKGIVTKIVEEINSAKVFLDIGIPLAALITKKSLDNMKIAVGTELYAIFKTMSVKVF